MDVVAAHLHITKDQAMAQLSQLNFLKVPATVQDTANAAVLIASDRARMMTGTVVNATAGAALAVRGGQYKKLSATGHIERIQYERKQNREDLQ